MRADLHAGAAELAELRAGQHQVIGKRGGAELRDP